MVNINIYFPKKIDFNLDLPTTWNELDFPELHHIADNFLKEQPIAETKADILKFIIEYRCKKAKQKLPADWTLLVDLEDFQNKCFPIIAPLFEKANRTVTPEPFRYRFHQYLLPATFDQMSCGEFEDCEVQAGIFQTTPGPEPLAKIASILFRPADTPYLKYKHRTATYNKYANEKKEPFFLIIPPGELYSIFLWYTGCRSLLPVIFKHLYNSGGKQSKPDPMIFTKTIHAGAGEKNGSREKIRASNLYEFLFECDLEAKKNKELQAYYDSLK